MTELHILFSSQSITPLIISVSYANADTQKEIILKDNKNKSGIYRFTHIDSNKVYVGSSVNLYRRFAQYYSIILITKTAKSSLICRALLKYDYSKFKLNIIEKL